MIRSERLAQAWAHPCNGSVEAERPDGDRTVIAPRRLARRRLLAWSVRCLAGAAVAAGHVQEQQQQDTAGSGEAGGRASAGAPDGQVPRILYCVPGAWTEGWYDDPSAWWQWCCAFSGWSAEAWEAFSRQWRGATIQGRRHLEKATGLRFFDWATVQGGSVHGLARVTADRIAEDLAGLPAEADVTLLGHSKGGNAVTLLLASRRDWSAGAKPARAIVVDAPVDAPRQAAAGWLGLGVERARLTNRYLRVPCATVNNWFDPVGGTSRGARNYQTAIWQDHLDPLPPHGLKGFLAERVLRDLGALPADA